MPYGRLSIEAGIFVSFRQDKSAAFFAAGALLSPQEVIFQVAIVCSLPSNYSARTYARQADRQESGTGRGELRESFS
jgi:hypothetical protein